jgi:hypothetical protein
MESLISTLWLSAAEVGLIQLDDGSRSSSFVVSNAGAVAEPEPLPRVQTPTFFDLLLFCKVM